MRLPLLQLTAVCLLACGACVHHAPKDRPVSRAEAPTNLRASLAKHLQDGERVESMVERTFQGKLVGYYITVTRQGAARPQMCYFHPSTGEFTRLEHSRLPSPLGEY
ncbi:hypothetical protein AYO49_05560 [Verrucomicrobiaceae bacterium SCGC AG-212-N21]|nr:hypothetical protein AYO49_05560 [Verrucomicrobiaceae bacterium SCGC AG-212-N21]